ncbi:hypothetical protein Dimus_012612 [Dionaea muscipula]
MEDGKWANDDSSSSSRRRSTRQQMAEKKKARDELIRAALSVKDPLAPFPDSLHYRKNGISVCFKSGRGDSLSSTLKQSMRNLLKLNMEGHFGPEWHTEEKVKYREMIASEARFIFVFETNEEKTLFHTRESEGSILGFAHYRFTLEEELPVLYVYELQLQLHAQGKGLGEFMMQQLELIARKNQMGAIMLTVQKSNSSAMRFYISKLRYTISSISPSRVVPPISTEKNYEILCKTFDDEGKAKLE